MQVLEMSQTREDPSQESFKPSKLLFLLFSDKKKNIEFLSHITRLAVLTCLVLSISLAIYTSFSAHPTRFPNFTIPTRKPISKPDSPSGPTNISHILFNIGGSLNTWHDRSRYSNLWWVPNTTRGFVWLDEKPDPNITSLIPVRVSSHEWTRFKYSSSRSAVRIARIVLDSFKLGVDNVRWFVMGDDDTVFFTENLVSVLAKYDHNQMWYIGGNSESVEQDVMHAYDMAFGGGGFALSYALAELLVNILDGCLDRYYYFYGSDQRIWACLQEIGVPLTREPGFHQFDIRASPYGLLSAHPQVPLLSLHHLDYVYPLFPNHTQIDSVNMLHHVYKLDPLRILQQSICYNRKRKWSIAVSWGYTVQIYPLLLTAFDLHVPLQTFKTWRTWSDGPFTFNTRPVKLDPCEQPVIYFLDEVQEVGNSGTRTTYVRYEEKRCERPDYVRVMAIERITVSALKMPLESYKKAPRRQCCEIMDGWSVKNDNLHIRIRNCRPREAVTP